MSAAVGVHEFGTGGRPARPFFEHKPKQKRRKPPASDRASRCPTHDEERAAINVLARLLRGWYVLGGEVMVRRAVAEWTEVTALHLAGRDDLQRVAYRVMHNGIREMAG